MTEEQLKRMEDIHSIAFAAINQIAYWKKYGKDINGDSLKIAFEGIIKLCDEQKEEVDQDENT